MEIGLVGLGRMGGNIARRLMTKGGHRVVVYDTNPQAVSDLVAAGAIASNSLQDLAGRLAAPRVVWLMLPAGAITEEAVTTLKAALAPGDTLIDGGNSFWQDDVRRARELGARGLHYVDVGTSGGVWGLERGYCMMIGGDAEVVHRSIRCLRVAPGAAIPRTAVATAATARRAGLLHAVPSGAGHVVKMIHNASNTD